DAIRNDMGLARACAVRPALHLNLTKVFSKIEASSTDIYIDGTGSFDRANLNAFYGKLGADGYASLLNKTSSGSVLTSAQIADLNNHQGDVSVTFGGYKWTVTYLSQNTSGEVIATLWYDDAEDTVPFTQNWCSSSTTGGFADHLKISSHYGSSSIRAIALGNGGDYYQGTSNSVDNDSAITRKTATEAEAQASKFYKFAKGNLAKYLTAPSQVEWQQNGGEYQNEALVKVTNDWHTVYPNIGAGQDDPLYFQWADDKVWLPSLSETYQSNSGYGIWNTSESQRKAKGTYSWTRSGLLNASNVFILNSQGGFNHWTTANNAGLRPAIHLNLSEVERNVSNGYYTDINKDLQARWNAAVEESLFSGKQVTFTLDKNWYALPDPAYDTSFGTGAGFSNGRIYVPQGADIVLDLNGYILDRNLVEANQYGNTVANYGTITVRDGSQTKLGTIRGAYSNPDIGGGLGSFSKAVINGGRFIYNQTVTGGGSAVFSGGLVGASELIVNDGYFAHNITGGNGTFVVVGTLEMNGGITAYNEAQKTGSTAGIYMHTGSSSIVNGGEFFANKSGRGGAFYLSSANLTINDVTTHDNSAESGGAIYALGASNLHILGGDFQYNSATITGGVMNVEGKGLVIIEDGNFRDNQASNGSDAGAGGAICLSGATLTINGGSFLNNNGLRYGGAIYIGSGTVNLYGGLISKNASVRGGGIDIVGGILNMYGGSITENQGASQTDSGAGIYMHSAGTLNLYGGTISPNKSTGYGAIYMGGAFNLYGGIVSGNTKADGSTKTNVYLPSGTTIQVKGACGSAKDKTLVGVTMAGSGAFTSGYVSSGNSLSLGANYFFADNGKAVVASGNELTIGTANASSKTTLTWRYAHNGTTTAIPATSFYVSVPYTGNGYTLSILNSSSAAVSISTLVDENGSLVTSPTQAGKYYATSVSMASYNNPVLTFEILPQSLEGAQVSVAGSPIYNGSEQTPEVTVTLNSVKLLENRDYTLEYAQNTDAGTAKVIVSGAGNYRGTLYQSFEIQKRNVEIRWNDLTKEYSGAAQAPLAFVEGLLDGDSVSLTLAYQLDGK
ncbi:MAG: hypothetical protein NC489_45360, partial [Ruminococcus flavefaciens]|nr:hypothetical protein [Ruminococcus flavefaciens]